jgi:PAS domain S-box-containing protein
VAGGDPALHETAEELYDGAPCGYFSTSPDGRFLRANETFLTWTGYAREELLERRFQELLSIGGRIFYETHLGPLVKMQGFVHEVQLEIVKKDGSLLPVLFNTLTKSDDAGRPLLQRSTVMNISDRRQYERELVIARKRAEAAARAKADFLSMMSHEIRTPMGAIVGVAALLKETELSPPQQRYVRILESSSQALLDLLNNILDFSRIEAGKAALVEQPFDVRDLFYDTLYALNVKAEAKHLDMRLELDEQLPERVVGDRIKIGQVLTNLVSNAIKFTERGRITVTVQATKRAGDVVTLEIGVRDTGIGIAADRLQAIFEEFTQAEADTSAKYGGTGLGLAISRKVLELYQTRMNVESTLGEGSRFWFELRLPVAPAGSVVLDDGPVAQAPQHSLKGKRALVVDDHEVNRVILSRILARWDIDVELANDGREAVEKARAGHFDFILMDLRMPAMDGYEATRLLRASLDARLAKIPIIAVSASARVGVEERVEDAGLTCFLGKPFLPEQLWALLAKHVLPAT